MSKEDHPLNIVNREGLPSLHVQLVNYEDKDEDIPNDAIVDLSMINLLMVIIICFYY